MWYYSENNQQLGPVTEDELKQKARSGSLKPTTLVWKDGMSDWKPISEIAELGIALQTAPAAAPTVLGPPAAVPNPYAAPQASVVSRPAMNLSSPAPYINSGGILAFAIVSTVMCCWPCGIPAIVYAAKINGQIASGNYLGAHESARLSKMWSWISVGSVSVILVIYVIAMALGVASGNI